MKRQAGRAILVALCAVVAAGAGQARGAQPPTQTTVLGRSVTLAGEQVHTVVSAEQWHGSGLWVPKAGAVTVTVLVRVKALKKTSYNGLYYRLRDASGSEWGTAYVGSRQPQLGSSNRLQRGKIAAGWLTFSLPAAKARSLSLVYRMSAGFGPRLIVRIGTPAVRTGTLGKAYPIASEHVFTALAAERWPGGGLWQPKAGNAYVTVNVRVQAQQPTAPGRLSLFSADGSYYNTMVLGKRDPAFDWKAPLAAGASIEGWATFVVPEAALSSLTLCYHVHSGAGPTVLFPLGSL